MFGSLSYFSIIKIIFIIYIILFRLCPYFSPIAFDFINRGLKVNPFSYIFEMFDNLTIYREKYLITGFEKRYYKNGFIYEGYFEKGDFSVGMYYKYRGEDYKKFFKFGFYLKITQNFELAYRIQSAKLK